MEGKRCRRTQEVGCSCDGQGPVGQCSPPVHTASKATFQQTGICSCKRDRHNCPIYRNRQFASDESRTKTIDFIEYCVVRPSLRRQIIAASADFLHI